MNFEELFQTYENKEHSVRVHVSKGIQLVNAASAARICRSNKPLEILFAEQFKKEKFQNTIEDIVVGFGDRSVAEMVTIFFVVEGLSLLDLSMLVRGRLMSLLQESTRAVDLTDATFKSLSKDEESIQKEWMKLYFRVKDEATSLLSEKHPFESFASEDLTEKDARIAYNQSVKAAAFDYARDFLPNGVVCRVAFQMNLRMLISKIHKWCSPLRPTSIRAVGELLKMAVMKQIPCLSKSVSTERDPKPWHTLTYLFSKEKDQELDSFNSAKILKFVAPSILKLSRCHVVEDVKCNSGFSELTLPEVLELRKDRFADVPSDFEDAIFQIGFKGIALGDAREWWRHRMVSMSVCRLHLHNAPFPSFARDFPEYWKSSGLEHDFLFLWSRHQNVYCADSPYALPLCTMVSFEMNVNLRSLITILELRLTKGAHPNVRDLSIDLVDQIEPFLKDHFGIEKPYKGLHFDCNRYALGRLDGEQHLRRKIAKAALLKEKEER
jgi:thymidylate synthase ThyX